VVVKKMHQKKNKQKNKQRKEQLWQMSNEGQAAMTVM
jgi:hypothetical protein